MSLSLARQAGVLAAAVSLALALAACGSSDGSSTSGPSGAAPSTPGPASATGSTAGGEPRTSGYWEMWSSCGANSQASTAAANGGRDAGWILADDLLRDPGIEVGPLPVKTCAQGLALLRSTGSDGVDHAADPAYGLAAQLYTAELNLAAGARGCDAVEGAVIAASALLTEMHFAGSGAYPALGGSSDYAGRIANIARQLALYNSGSLC